MNQKSLETMAAGLASMNLGTAPATDVMNEPGGAALAAIKLKEAEAEELAPESQEDPRRR